MALVTYHGPRPEITASFPMGPVLAFSRDDEPPIADVLTFRNGRPDELKKPGPHSYVLPKDHPVPVGVVFAVGLAILMRERDGLWLTVRLGPGDWAMACAAMPLLRAPDEVPDDEELMKESGGGIWPQSVVRRHLRWDVQALRASNTRNLSVNENLNWRPRG